MRGCITGKSYFFPTGPKMTGKCRTRTRTRTRAGLEFLGMQAKESSLLYFRFLPNHSSIFISSPLHIPTQDIDYIRYSTSVR